MSETVTDFEELASRLAEELIKLVDTTTPQPVLLIDGRAGAGKSTLAQRVTDLVFKRGESKPTLVHLDDLYPGWSGLQAGASYALHNLLMPLAKGKAASWQLWNWETDTRGRPNEPGNGWREFRGGTPLIVEGCGALSRQSAELADVTVWLEVPTALRQERWRKRDGERFDAYWPTWAAQEDELLQQERPMQLADFVLLTEDARG